MKLTMIQLKFDKGKQSYQAYINSLIFEKITKTVIIGVHLSFPNCSYYYLSQIFILLVFITDIISIVLIK